MRSRQPKRRILPQSFDNSRDEFLYSTGAAIAHTNLRNVLAHSCGLRVESGAGCGAPTTVAGDAEVLISIFPRRRRPPSQKRRCSP
jgi:hypothetical protein